MVPSKRRSPGVATNNPGGTNEEKHNQYTAILREFAGCVALGIFIGTVMGQCAIGMLDAQRSAALKMQRAASMAGVDHGR